MKLYAKVGASLVIKSDRTLTEYVEALKRILAQDLMIHSDSKKSRKLTVRKPVRHELTS
jgi:hypothetical protein